MNYGILGQTDNPWMPVPMPKLDLELSVYQTKLPLRGSTISSIGWFIISLFNSRMSNVIKPLDIGRLLVILALRVAVRMEEMTPITARHTCFCTRATFCLAVTCSKLLLTNGPNITPNRPSTRNENFLPGFFTEHGVRLVLLITLSN